MKSLGMGSDRYDLTDKIVDQTVTKDNLPGNYALGYVNNDNNKFVVKYVGRVDNNLARRLKQHIAEIQNDEKWKKRAEYLTTFKFSYAQSIKEAFETECRNYHDFGGKDGLFNERHPKRPNDTNLSCPEFFCTELDE